LGQAGLPSSRLELEITETALLQNNEAVLVTLYRLRKLGVRTVLDDFGTGYSSLSYLRSFPFDKLKIDQIFVREMVTRPDCQAIVNSIANLARQLGMMTTAEGIETHEQLDQVRRTGCTEAQGYYFSPPQPAPLLPPWGSDMRELTAAA
jgi:EAL domain-containing protein (putative c-di-GMP-specific phosphodiesterase class I)